MNKKNIYQRSLRIPLIKMALDASAVLLAVAGGYYLRFFSPLTAFFPVTQGIPPSRNYLYFALFLILLFLVLFSFFSSYRSRFFSSFRQDIPLILQVSLLGILIAMSAAFLYRGFSYSRLVFVLIYLSLNGFLLLERYLFHKLKRALLRSGLGSMRVFLAGSSDNLRQIGNSLSADESFNFDVIGYFANEKIADLPMPYRGSILQLPEKLQKADGIDGLVLALDQEMHSQLLGILKSAEGRNLEIFYIPDILDILTSNVQTFEVAGIPVLRLKAFVLSGWQGFIKRAFDISATLMGLMLLMPFLLLIALLIKLSSPGPVLYRQKRVGLDGREFSMLKFRSMRPDAEVGSGPVWAQKNDPRVTAIGRFLRRSSLDELPQLLNVLKGDMSLVGPRPERQYFVEQFQQIVPQYIERHRVRSGMTGWAQVNGMRGQTPIEVRTRYDLYYIENWSLWFDLKIILMTLMEVLRGENAY